MEGHLDYGSVGEMSVLEHAPTLAMLLEVFPVTPTGFEPVSRP